MADLRIRDFPDDLLHDLKVEAAHNGEHLRTLVIRTLDKERDTLRKTRLAKEREAQ